jgi:tetratricopeptide (TPR) repeat protein
MAGLLVAMTLAAYAPVVHNGFIWDDDAYVTENVALRSLTGLGRIWLDFGATPQYYPMVHTTFWVEYQLWQLDPSGYHVVNVALHILVVLLLWRVLALLAIPGAWFAAALFAVHPVHVESVAWITERKNVLSGAFYLASLFAYLRSTGFGEQPPGEARAFRLYALALIAFVAALLSKTVAGSLPAVILLIQWLKCGRIESQSLRSLAPFFALAVGFGLLTVRLETQHVGAAGSSWDLSFVDRVLIAGRALWFYAGKLVWPSQLTFNYPRWQIDAASASAYLYPIAAIAVVMVCFSTRLRIGRGPVVAVLVFAGSLFPALGFFDVYPMRYSFVADHFQYLASIGLITLFASGAARFAAHSFPSRPALKALAAAFPLVLLIGGTWRQTHVYRDPETLWLDTLEKNPRSWLAIDHLGAILDERGQQGEAIARYREAIRVEPEHPEAHANLGDALRRQGALDESVAALRRALELEPNYALAHNNMGLTRHQRGEYAEAIREFERALEINPGSAAAHTNLGVTLAATGRRADALRHHRQALAIEPDLAAAHTNLALLLLEEGAFTEAIAHLSRVVDLLPESEEARRNLAAARRMSRAGGRTK